MRFLIIGIGGSMGQRRCRNLQSLGYTDIYGTDNNVAKGLKSCEKYNINFIPPFGKDGLVGCKPDVIIISTPPLTKEGLIFMANYNNMPCFCEADVKIYPGDYTASATMRFHPAIQKMKGIIDSGKLGQIYTFTHHCGNHIEDWHPGANKKTYYAMTKEAGGCKEIFPFELSWLSYLFGTPIDCAGMVDKKLNDVDIKADDVYSTVVRFQNEKAEDYGFRVWPKLFHTIGTILIDIVCRPAIRELRIVAEKGTLLWNWDNSFISIDFADGTHAIHGYDKGKAAEGYNQNICEFMYEQEIKNWIESIQSKAKYLYSREEEKACIDMLKKVENNYV